MRYFTNNIKYEEGLFKIPVFQYTENFKRFEFPFSEAHWDFINNKLYNRTKKRAFKRYRRQAVKDLKIYLDSHPFKTTTESKQW